ncbi:hypothetical protein HB364_03810 [Pseudoflavitalea sp. X16]|uniref:hypothetical protein n=1 Tax=Paraflavitalea devenefica TaxID=2716334 RepID=UPI001421F82B|nr:hypothetical protein [Paraflavitalea devenefica]NII24187.1 hypothetical protein [Paraflavitalea devenefica]
MTILFTPEELIQYLYQETSPEKTAAIEASLQEDWTLREKLEVLRTSVKSLDRIVESPRPQVLLNIMNYARESAIESVE